jgi:DNA repair exonuclease SbcCD ATPase subunit
MTAAALALFYALAESASHSFDLLFIDDPTQNLDEKRKEAMARAIAQIAKHKQVVISTHDADFEAKLGAAGFKDGAACFWFHDWNGDPQVSRS